MKYRIIDANINRCSEALRVLEDFFRFDFENKNLSEELKTLRHQIRKDISILNLKLIEKRNSKGDIGFKISQEVKLDIKKNKKELIFANFKRVQESLRSIEETLKIIGKYDLSKKYESYRFLSYNIEKDFFSLKKKLPDTDIYSITGEKFSKGRDNIEVVKELINADVKIIQYREKEKKKLYKYNECKIIREMTLKNNICFIVNDDIEIAMSVKADGIHLGQEDIPIIEARKIIGDEMIIGLSTHAPKEAKKALEDGADYIGVGPIFKTNTKEDVVDPVGLEYLEYIVKNIDIPFVAIGGVKRHNIKEVIDKGAKMIAMVTEIIEADDIIDRVKDIRNIIYRGDAETQSSR